MTKENRFAYGYCQHRQSRTLSTAYPAWPSPAASRRRRRQFPTSSLRRRCRRSNSSFDVSSLYPAFSCPTLPHCPRRARTSAPAERGALIPPAMRFWLLTSSYGRRRRFEPGPAGPGRARGGGDACVGQLGRERGGGLCLGRDWRGEYLVARSDDGFGGLGSGGWKRAHRRGRQGRSGEEVAGCRDASASFLLLVVLVMAETTDELETAFKRSRATEGKIPPRKERVRQVLAERRDW